MRAGLRPYVTAGVALVGASAIAVAPVAPPQAEVAIAQPVVQLGQIDEFFAAASDIVLQPGRSAGAALVHLGAILSQPYAPAGFLITAVSPVLSGLVATGQAIAEVFDAITSLDLVGAVNAVVNIPARIIDGDGELELPTEGSAKTRGPETSSRATYSDSEISTDEGADPADDAAADEAAADEAADPTDDGAEPEADAA